MIVTMYAKIFKNSTWVVMDWFIFTIVTWKHGLYHLSTWLHHVGITMCTYKQLKSYHFCVTQVIRNPSRVVLELLGNDCTHTIWRMHNLLHFSFYNSLSPWKAFVTKKVCIPKRSKICLREFTIVCVLSTIDATY